MTGHTACGGCIAAHSLPADTKPSNALLEFLGPLIKIRAGLGEDATVEDLMVANVKQGVENVCNSAVSRCDVQPSKAKANKQTIQEAWAKGKDVYVHGWVYDLASGHCHDLGISRGPPFQKL